MSGKAGQLPPSAPSTPRTSSRRRGTAQAQGAWAFDEAVAESHSAPPLNAMITLTKPMEEKAPSARVGRSGTCRHFLSPVVLRNDIDAVAALDCLTACGLAVQDQFRSARVQIAIAYQRLRVKVQDQVEVPVIVHVLQTGE